MTVTEAAKILGATPSDIAGLWNAPGHPELTTAQMIYIATEKLVPPAADPIGFIQRLIRPAE